jgi:hypothetical protein
MNSLRPLAFADLQTTAGLERLNEQALADRAEARRAAKETLEGRWRDEAAHAVMAAFLARRNADVFIG